MSKIYCIYCGKENNIKDKKCKSCKKNLKAHDFELLKFIGKEVKDDSKGKFIDYIFEFIKTLFTKHVYGVVLSLSVVVAAGSTVLNLTNNNEGYNEKITNEKYSFNEVEDSLKFVGCWAGTNEYEKDTIWYRKFYLDGRVSSITITNNNASDENNAYYNIVTGYGDNTYKHLHFYMDPSHKEVEVQTFPFTFVDNNTFRYGELNYYEFLYKRIDCKDFPSN